MSTTTEILISRANWKKVKYLHKKLVEYKKELRDNPEVFRDDVICKITIIENLLLSGKVEPQTLLNEMNKTQKYFDPFGRFSSAYLVIKNYCDTGNWGSIKPEE